MVPYRAIEEEEGRHVMPSEATLLRSTPLELHACPSELLFRRCRGEGDPAAREELALRYLPLAHKVARRYAPSSVPYEDLAQVASLGLLKAIDRYDWVRGTRFEAFAIPTILGELKRYFRDSTWSVHVTRAAQEHACAVARTSELMVGDDGRGPTVYDLALYLELSEEKVLEGLRAAGIEAKVYFPPAHRQVVLALTTGRPDLPVTEDVAARMLSLPFHSRLCQSELGEIADTVQRLTAA